jgi:DSBA-like thioredoxin domain-containing protein
MHLIVYGDFNCPYSYLASQRADALVRAGRAEVEWCAVEHDWRLALTGIRSGSGPARWQRELAEVAALAGPDEQAPGAVPALVSNTGAAVAAYAEAVADGVQDELRRSLFSEIWVRLRHLSGPSEVRRLVRAQMYPAGPPGESLAVPDLPARIHHHAAPSTLPRLSGCTISPAGGPLTGGGHRRIGQWRREWLADSGGVVPALSLPDGMLTGPAALALLGDLAAAPAGAAVRAAAGPLVASGVG